MLWVGAYSRAPKPGLGQERASCRCVLGVCLKSCADWPVHTHLVLCAIGHWVIVELTNFCVGVAGCS